MVDRMTDEAILKVSISENLVVDGKKSAGAPKIVHGVGISSESPV
jgi:hypothetical protein